jgi:hypothetical protein
MKKKYSVAVENWGDVEVEAHDLEHAIELAVEEYYDQDPSDPHNLDVGAECEGQKFRVSADVSVNFYARPITTGSQPAEKK